jgi:polyisoprenoid-binding protein YceI
MTKETKWSIDQTHSEISFRVRHLMIAHVKGSFKTFDASIYTTGSDFKTANVDLWIDVASVTTGDIKRDEHLKSEEFFDAANYQQIFFTSHTMEKPSKDGLQDLWGELTIKGIKNNIKLSVEFGGMTNDMYGNEKAGFSLTGNIKRSDFELNWNSTLPDGGLVVGDEIQIQCDVELVNCGTKSMHMELAPDMAQADHK